MKLPFLVVCFAFLGFSSLSYADSFGADSNSFNIEFVTIGDPGNPGDFPVPFLSGSVAYTYAMGKYEISLDMVTKANADGGLGITTTNQSIFLGANLPDRPAVGVTWNEAARFVNWLNESTGYAPAYKFATEAGDAAYDSNESNLPWTASDHGFDAANPSRNLHAKYALPTFNERFKAAFYDPASMLYYTYPTGSNTLPTPVASGADVNTAVVQQSLLQGPAPVEQAGSLSPYGVMGLGGNAVEWAESPGNNAFASGSNPRYLLGGAWHVSASGLAKNNLGVVHPAQELADAGFRVVSLSVPEPATGLLLSVSATMCVLRRQR